MNITQNSIINISFTCFIIISILLYKFNILTTITDKILILIGVIASLLILISKKYILLDIAHFLYTLIIVGISLLSYNKYLLIFNTIMIFNIYISRLIFKGCILNTKQNKCGIFFTINKKIGLNWYYIFYILFIISYIRYLLIN